MQSYENKDLGISFQYPVNFKVYQSDKSSLTIDSSYEDAEHPLASIQIGIKKYSQDRVSLQEIESIVNPDFSGFIKILEAAITEEGREELRRQIEFTKRTNPEGYNLAYGDKSIDEALEEQVKTIQEQIKDIKTKRAYKILNKVNYDIIVVDSADKYYPYYLLSDKGTFIVDHLQTWQNGFVPEQEYNSYKEKFDSIVNSIKII
ncbi:hypothetical protein HYX06_02785 [Candidatus Woesearchaeota archaeon]|nr:hypothetical protein [Candidatus Woesearchaeota archaeon]